MTPVQRNRIARIARARQRIGNVRSVVLAGAALCAFPANAQTPVEARYSAAYHQCMKTGDAAAGVTSGMMDCIGLEIDRQDARLNRAYKAVMARLAATQRTGLRISERNWIRDRDARCRRASAPEGGGSAGALLYSGCILDETIRRTLWLERYKAA